MGNRFLEAIKKGVTGVQDAYTKQCRAAEVRAKRRAKAATTRYGKERAKADLETEKLVLQRQMYEAKAKVVAQKVEVKKARLAAGELNICERAERFGKRTMVSVRSLQAPKKATRSSTARTSRR